jgi:N-acetylmuramoyl-L-alanine amidase
MRRFALLPARRSSTFGLRILLPVIALAVSGCASTGGPQRVGPYTISEQYAAQSQDSRVQYIVLHYTQTNFAESLDTLTHGPVSSHYLVDANPARIYRLVPEDRRAWHAGKSFWQGQTGLNASSIGIEIVNDGNRGNLEGPFAPWDPAQIEAVVVLVKDIAARHGVQPHHIVGHSDIAPQRKQDPGAAFPWQTLVAAGLVPWPDAAQVAAAQTRFSGAVPSVAWFQEKLAAHGFEVPRNGELDDATRRVIISFQMKYRPARWDGEPDAETAAWLEVATTPGGLRLFRNGQWQVYQPQ